ncbi:MAG: endonuclease Q family protein [Candidatus Cloacimonetes bacterium]|nr:endonuclease Q family protein [Candidatus Cloacimonadota bacterium]
MKIAVDLHSHSGYAGGVGNISLSSVAETMKWKGIDVFATGDCLYPPRTDELRELLIEKDGLFHLKNDEKKFILQTEVILSTKLPSYRNRTVAHHVILFPNFESVLKMQKLMNKWQMKNTIGRPFITTKTQSELEQKFFEIADIHALIEIIPAHVMTPDGIMGSKNMLTNIDEFYGKFTSQIRVIETGLSADPDMLGKIPDFSEMTMISSSDCHSAALNRVGREFTILEADTMNYSGIISALRNNDVFLTAEFNPAEGRYFLTGHREDKEGHSEEIFFVEDAPAICPVCGKKMTLGVKQRCLQLQKNQDLQFSKRKFIHLIPLIEVIAYAFKTKNVSGRKVVECYKKIMNCFSDEISLWQSSVKQVQCSLEGKIEKTVINAICSVINGNFNFDPAGFDGKYGQLNIF